jgi:hypothetical protein
LPTFDYSTPFTGSGRQYADFGIDGLSDAEQVRSHIKDLFIGRGFEPDTKTSFLRRSEMHIVTVSSITSENQVLVCVYAIDD